MRTDVVDEGVLLGVKKDVADLVEEREPKDVVPAVSETELHESFVGGEPTRGSVDSRSLDFGLGHDGDSDAGALFDELFPPPARILIIGQSAQLLKKRSQPRLVERGTVNRCRLD